MVEYTNVGMRTQSQGADINLEVIPIQLAGKAVRLHGTRKAGRVQGKMTGLRTET